MGGVRGEVEEGGRYVSDIGTSVAKFLKHGDHLMAMQAGPVWPLHLAILCTSRCQLDCPFCVVKRREKGKDLDFAVFREVAGQLRSHGGRAIQFSGGDPFAWPHIDEALKYCHEVDIRVGVQSNGLEAHKHVQALATAKWMRVSVYTQEQMARLRLDGLPKSLHLSLSTVWHAGSTPEFLKQFRDYALSVGACHARVVQDLNDRDSEHAALAPDLVRELGAPLVFVRRADQPTHFCAIAWWKAAMDWDGNLYSCGCIAAQDRGGRLPKNLRICHATGMQEFFDKQRPHDLGHRCYPCSYWEQNELMRVALTPCDDPEFL